MYVNISIPVPGYFTSIKPICKEMHLKYLKDLENEIDRGPAHFKENLCQIMLKRKEIFIDSGLAKSSDRAMKIIKKKHFNIKRIHPTGLNIDYTSIEKNPYQYVYLFLEYMYDARISWAEEVCKEIYEADNQTNRCDKIFKAWTELMICRYGDDKDDLQSYIVNVIKAFSNLDEFLIDIVTRENELKNILGFYFYFSSRPVDEKWKQMVQHLCEIVNYFRKDHEKEKPHQYWKQLQLITDKLLESKALEDVWKSLASRQFSSFKFIPLVLEEQQKRYEEVQDGLHQRISRAGDRDDDIGLLHWLLLKYYKRRLEERMCLNLILHSSVFEFLLQLDNLSSDNPYVRSVLDYFIDTSKLVLEIVCYQSAFNRTSYALKNKELLDVIIDKLRIRKNDIFLDLFSNIPVASYCACLLGAKVYSIDCDFVEKDEFTESLKDMYDRQKKFARDLLNMFETPVNAIRKLSDLGFEDIVHLYRQSGDIGGPFMQHKVDPEAIEASMKYFSFFRRIIESNPPKFRQHRFSLEEFFKEEDRTEFSDNYFDKMLIDPPYGKETAHEGFGPEQGLVVAKKGLSEAFRVLKKSGKAVLTLPSLKWEAFRNMEWREKALAFGRSCGFIQIDREDDLPSGRALVLLEKR